MSAAQEQQLQKMVQLLRLTNGQDMKGTDFGHTRAGGRLVYDGDLYTQKEIEEIGYANSNSLWVSLNKLVSQGRCVYRAPEGGDWPSVGLICWRSDFMLEHANVIRYDELGLPQVSFDVLAAMSTVRTDKVFRPAFLRSLRHMRDLISADNLERQRLSNRHDWFRWERDPEVAEAFVELMHACGIFERLGESPHGLCGYVWRFNRARYETLAPLVYLPIEVFVAAPKPYLVWDANRQSA